MKFSPPQGGIKQPEHVEEETAEPTTYFQEMEYPFFPSSPDTEQNFEPEQARNNWAYEQSKKIYDAILAKMPKSLGVPKGCLPIAVTVGITAVSILGCQSWMNRTPKTAFEPATSSEQLVDFVVAQWDVVNANLLAQEQQTEDQRRLGIQKLLHKGDLASFTQGFRQMKADEQRAALVKMNAEQRTRFLDALNPTEKSAVQRMINEITVKRGPSGQAIPDSALDGPPNGPH